MRLFFAVPVEGAARTAVAAVLDRLAKTGADYKWTPAENLHLTLAFLGETPEDRLPALKTALAGATSGKSRFTLVFDRVGAFDSLEHPRVLWLGAGQGEEALAGIAAPLIPPEETRAFEVHLTLGRQRGARGLRRLKDELARLGPIRIESRVDRVVLMRSRLSSKGPAYEELTKAHLG